MKNYGNYFWKGYRLLAAWLKKHAEKAGALKGLDMSGRTRQEAREIKKARLKEWKAEKKLQAREEKKLAKAALKVEKKDAKARKKKMKKRKKLQKRRMMPAAKARKKRNRKVTFAVRLAELLAALGIAVWYAFRKEEGK